MESLASAGKDGVQKVVGSNPTAPTSDDERNAPQANAAQCVSCEASDNSQPNAQRNSTPNTDLKRDLSRQETAKKFEAVSPEMPADLRELAGIWPKIPEAVRSSLLTPARSAAGEAKS